MPSDADRSSLGSRFQSLTLLNQALVLSRIVAGRNDGLVTPQALAKVFESIGLKAPGNVSDTLSALGEQEKLARTLDKKAWKLTPIGREMSIRLVSSQDLSQLIAQNATVDLATLGSFGHALLPPNFAPPVIVNKVEQFGSDTPFDLSVFGITRFPSPSPDDPVQMVIDRARQATFDNGLTLSFAFDGNIHSELWGNVTAYMWSSKYGIVFMEDRVERGINYNLAIELGAMLALGRRCLILKDRTVPAEDIPTDLVGFIYRDVDLSDPESVYEQVAAWINLDLRLDLGSNPR